MAGVSGPRIASLILRVFTFVMLLISLIILITNKSTIIFEDYGNFLHDGDIDDAPMISFSIYLDFKEFQSYIYMLATIALGITYTLLQIAFSIYLVIMINDKGNPLFDFYGDKIVSCMLGTGVAAGFGIAVDMKSKLPVMYGYGDETILFNPFLNKSFISCSFLLFAFLSTAISSVISSYLLPKKV